MKNNKIIQVIDSLNVGGTEVLAVNIANELASIGYESHLCVTREEGSLKKQISKEVGYCFLSKKGTIDLKAINKLKKYIIANQIAIIHAHSTSFFIAYIIKMLCPKVKLVWHNHTGSYVNLKGYKKQVIKLVLRKFSQVINVNLDLNIWTKTNFKNIDTLYIPNFCEFSNNDKITNLKGKEGKRILLLAGLREEKDHLTALKAFKLLVKENPDWTLHFVGKDYNNEYSKKIKNYIKTNGLTNSVFLYGLCADIQYILSQVTIGILSSKSEGLPISLLEYGLANLPVVVTNVGECSKVIEDNISGSIVIPNNENELFEKINNLVEDTEIRLNYAKNFNDRVSKYYSKESFFTKLNKIYDSL